VAALVESDSDGASAVAARAQLANRGQRGLLGWVWFQVHAVGGEPVAVLDVTDTLA
jgi:hypothetical protein